MTASAFESASREEICGIESSGSSYLASRDELEGTKSSLEVGNVGLEIVECVGDTRLDLGRVLPRWAVGRNLVQGGRRHVGGCVDGCRNCRCRLNIESRNPKSKVHESKRGASAYWL